MNRKAISAYIAGCEPGEFMAYADLGEKGTVVVGPDGRKFRYSNDQLKKAEADRSAAHAPKPKPKPRSPSKRKPAKKTSKPTTHQKPKSDPKLL
jgi:hypothetical protein